MNSRKVTAVAAIFLLFTHVAGVAGSCALCVSGDVIAPCAQAATPKADPVLAPSCCCDITCAEVAATEAVMPEVPLSSTSPVSLVPDSSNWLATPLLFRSVPVTSAAVSLPVLPLYKLTHSYLL